MIVLDSDQIDVILKDINKFLTVQAKNHLQVLIDMKLNYYPNGFPYIDTVGMFANVGRYRNTKNARAIRLFKVDIKKIIPDINIRYQLIHQNIQQYNNNPIFERYFVKFNYLERGIKYNGSFYPIITMEWVDGKWVHYYLNQLTNIPSKDRISKIDNLIEQFLELMNFMKSSGIAHGDLQHRNLLVTNSGELKLIDYDTMYFPNMNLNFCPATGHPAFQHPSRSSDHFDENMDNFSSLIIFLTLAIISMDYNIWTKYDTEENFLINSDDLIIGENFVNTEIYRDMFIIINKNKDSKWYDSALSALHEIANCLKNSDFHSIKHVSKIHITKTQMKSHISQLIQIFEDTTPSTKSNIKEKSIKYKKIDYKLLGNL